jgi:hypothetical protein
LFDSEGKLQSVDSVPAKTQSYTYRFPPEQSTFEKIVGQAGTEFVFLCGRPDRVPSVEDFQQSHHFAKPWPELSDKTVLQVSPAKVEYLQQDRGFGGRVQASDPDRLA